MTPYDPQPLPVRIDPQPDEAFYSYVHRVAKCLQVTANTLLTPIMAPSSETRARRLRDRCLGVTRPHAELIGRYFNLESAQVRGMFAALTPQAISTPTSEQLDSWDPLTPDYRPIVPIPAEFAAPGLARRCIKCLKDDPPSWRTSWQFTYNLTCGVHGVYLHTENRTALVPIGLVRQSETRVLDIAHRRLTPAHGMPRDTYLDTVSDCLASTNHRLPHHLGEALVAIVNILDRAETGISDLTAVKGVRRQSPAFWRERPKPPHPDIVRRWPETRAHYYTWIPVQLGQYQDKDFPEVLPAHLYYGALSDLAYPLDLYLGRVIAGAHCHGKSPLVMGTPSADLERGYVSLMTRLELDGRLPTWWEHIQAAIANLTTDFDYTLIDYARQTPSGFERVARKHVPPAEHDLIRIWLDDTACIRRFDRPDPARMDAFLSAHEATLIELLVSEYHRRHSYRRRA